MTAVSACLLGKCCKYSGGHNKNEAVIEHLQGREHIPVCPETLGGLTAPRPPSEITGGGGADVLKGAARVVDKNGNDVTSQFLNGANMALELCIKRGVTAAILKERSPSCGVRRIYDGTFTGKVIGGEGVCAAALRGAGIKLLSEEDF